MKTLAPVRAALGVRTVFNLLGPLTNPGSPRFYLIGAFSVEAARLMAEAISGMQIERAWVTHGARGWDEATPIGPFHVFDVQRDQVTEQLVDPLEFGLARAAPAALAGGDSIANLAALRAVFERRDAGAHLDALALQSGIAMHIAGRAASVREGIDQARQTVASGRAAAWLQQLQQQRGP
jgi:anthranilate phosphoribosyltransferase